MSVRARSKGWCEGMRIGNISCKMAFLCCWHRIWTIEGKKKKQNKKGKKKTRINVIHSNLTQSIVISFIVSKHYFTAEAQAAGVSSFDLLIKNYGFEMCSANFIAM